MKLGSVENQVKDFQRMIWDTKKFVAQVRQQPRRHVKFIVFYAVGLFAVLLDGFTTAIALHTGEYEEINVAALAGMGRVGVELYVIVATLVSIALSLLLWLRGPGLLPRALVGFSVVFLFIKILTVIGNVTGWAWWNIHSW